VYGIERNWETASRDYALSDMDAGRVLNVGRLLYVLACNLQEYSPQVRRDWPSREPLLAGWMAIAFGIAGPMFHYSTNPIYAFFEKNAFRAMHACTKASRLVLRSTMRSTSITRSSAPGTTGRPA
jgi:hypothetical protein